MEVTAVHVKAAKTALDSRQTTTTAIAARIRPVVPFSENLRIDYFLPVFLPVPLPQRNLSQRKRLSLIV